MIRTSSTIPARGGALVTGYDHSLMRDGPLTEYGVITEEDQWENLKWFLERVVPVAEEANVKLAMHPDDPPLDADPGRKPHHDQHRELSKDDRHGAQPGEWHRPVPGQLYADDRRPARRDPPLWQPEQDLFVHFRDVRGTADHFEETFHDEGKTDMLACMRAYRDVGYEGVARPDHVPTMEGDSSGGPRYTTIGRLFAIGYMGGLREAVYAE